MSADVPIHVRQLLTGPLFSEPMQVETDSSNGPDICGSGPVDKRSGQIRRGKLTSDGISDLTIEEMLCGSHEVIIISEVFA